MSENKLPGALRKTLLLKLISKSKPTKEDLESIVELTSSKVIESLRVQSMTLFLKDTEEQDMIAFRYVYYSPTLWRDKPAQEKVFAEKRKKLLKLKIPMGKGVVGKVMETGKPIFYTSAAEHIHNMEKTSKEVDFEVHAMLTYPLKVGGEIIGAIQVLNREPGIQPQEFCDSDLKMIEEVAEYSAFLLKQVIDPKYQIDDRDTARFVSMYTGFPLVLDDKELPIDEKLFEVIGFPIIKRENIFPYKRMGPTSVAVLMPNPLDYNRREAFTEATEMSIEEVSVAPVSLIQSLLHKYFSDEISSGTATEEEETSSIAEIASILGEDFSLGARSSDLEDEESGPIIQVANRIIEDAYISGASDIHIEPQETDVLVRYRIDGVCQEKLRLPIEAKGALVARLKIMCNLDISEKRLPQDGRIVFKQYTNKDIDIDLRVATAPANFGEKVVMRILDKSKSALPITALGFSQENLEKYRACIKQPYGMLLHCGPTGSGKSMTLFSALREIASPKINVQTAEDPIEYTIPGINQMQMHKAIGLTFARALRAFLRMDPDVILVGEIRDRETADIAVEAALTGHLLLSTLHTNDAPSTIARFDDMGIEPFMISASLLVICAQRLMRRICKNCKEDYQPEGQELDVLQRAIQWQGTIYRARKGGCPICAGSGYKGRVGIHELMVNNEALTEAINAGSETAVLKRVAMKHGMKTLHQDSMLKVKEGVSTIMEAIATVPADAELMKQQTEASPKAS